MGAVILADRQEREDGEGDPRLQQFIIAVDLADAHVNQPLRQAGQLLLKEGAMQHLVDRAPDDRGRGHQHQCHQHQPSDHGGKAGKKIYQPTHGSLNLV